MNGARKSRVQKSATRGRFILFGSEWIIAAFPLLEKALSSHFLMNFSVFSWKMKNYIMPWRSDWQRTVNMTMRTLDFVHYLARFHQKP
jgi:hypothetical protein